MKGKINYEQQQDLASKILGVNIGVVKKVGVVRDNTDVLIVTVTTEGLEIPSGYKGGAKTLLIDSNKKSLLYTGSALSIDKLYEEFLNGRNTPIDKLLKNINKNVE